MGQEWWTREAWPCCRWPLRTPARCSSRRSEQCALTGARLGKRSGWWGSGGPGEALGGVAWLETQRCGWRISQNRGGVHRRWWQREERALGREWASAVAQGGGCVASRRRHWGWQEGPSVMCGWHLAEHVVKGWWFCPTESRRSEHQWPTKTQSSSTFYSRFTRWFWLKFVPIDRATQVLQDCLKDQCLVRLGFHTTMSQSTLGANFVNTLNRENG